MMLRQRLAIAADTPNLIPMPTAHAPPDRSTRQIAVRPYFRPLENRRSHSSNPHRSQRRNRAPSGPRFRALALLGRLSWERVDAFVMQASEKPAHFRTLPKHLSPTCASSHELYATAPKTITIIPTATDYHGGDDCGGDAGTKSGCELNSRPRAITRAICRLVENARTRNV